MELSLIGKYAFVGGSSKGIGKAAAIELANLGANVTVVARSSDKLNEVIDALDVSKGQQHQKLVLDYADIDTVKETVESYIKDTPIHILINNTGGPRSGPIRQAELSEFISALNNHLMVNHTLTTIASATMIRDGYGRVINVISTSVKEPLDNLGVSNTTRGAVASWSKTMSRELGPHGITVNNLLPGFTNTDRLKEIIDKKVSKSNLSEEDVIKGMKTRVPLGRFAEPKEVGGVIAFLASPSAAYINGTNIVVDGGRNRSL